MRRDSEPALRVVKLAEDSGLTVLGTRLETWAQEGMLWPEGTSDERKVEYLRLLLRLTGHRKSRDRAALIMAVHECPTARLRSALADPDAASPANDLDPDDPTVEDAIADTVEGYMATPLGTGTFKGTTAKVLDSIARERAQSASMRVGRDESEWEIVVEQSRGEGLSRKNAERVADRRIKPDEPDIFRQRVGAQVLTAYVNGGDFYDPDVVEAFTGLDAGEVDTLGEALPTLPTEASYLIETMPLNELATICRVSRDLLVGSGQRPPQFARLNDDDLDEMAAVLAPWFYVQRRHLLRDVLARFDVSESVVEAALRADVYGLSISDEDRAALPPLPTESEDSQA
jgi:hypothetical protein